MRKRLLFMLAATSIYFSSAIATPVEDNGKLHVDRVQLVNEEGNPVQLRGMSSHGLQWDVGYNSVSLESLTALRDDWGADIFRAAMYIGEGGYASNSNVKNRVYDIIDWTEQLGIYCLVDWHVLTPGDPNDPTYSGAEDFFDEISDYCKDKKHVLYEICNEPNGYDDKVASWENIKTYANKIIPVIRANDPNSVIMVGTPSWSQLNVWDESIVNDQLSYDNIMYSFHFYAGTHAGLQANFKTRICQLPVFVTEWGTSAADGNGGVFETEAAGWLDILAGNNDCGVLVSWCNWSFTDLDETSAALKPGAVSSKNWTNTSTSGTFVRNRMMTPDQWTPINSDPNAAPVLSSATVAANSVTLDFSSDIADFSTISGLTVTVDGAAATISSIDKIAADKLMISVNTTIVGGDNVIVSYSGSALKGANGVAVGTFTKTASNTLINPDAVSLIDDCEDGDNIISTGGFWYSFDDANNKGASTVTPSNAVDFTMSAGGADGSSMSAEITYSLDKGTNPYSPYVGMGITLDENESAYDVGDAEGLSFWYKGDAFIMEVELSTIKNYQSFQLNVPASNSWTEKTIKWSQLSQPDWGDGNVYVDWDPTKVVKIQFKIEGSTGDAGTLNVDELAFYGGVVLVENTPPALADGVSNMSLDEGFGSKTVSLSTAFYDAEGDNLTYTATSSNTSAATVSVSGSTLSITEKGIGDATITVTANDGNGGINQTTFHLTVNNVNDEPMVDSPLADVQLEQGFGSEIIDLSDLFSDEDGDALTISVSSSNTGVVSAAVSGTSLTISEVGYGTSTIIITATDNNGGMVSDEIIVGVNMEGNSVPTALRELQDQTLASGYTSTVISLINLFADVDGDELNITASSSDMDVAIVSINENILSITEIGAGYATITVTADDGKGGAISVEFDLSAELIDNIVENTPALNIYPVPFSDIISFSSEDAVINITVYTLTGAIATTANNVSGEADLSFLPLGTYVLNAVLESGAKVSTIITKE